MSEQELQAIDDHILFEFVEDVGGGGFLQKSGSGVVIAEGHEKQLDTCRWIRALSIGPDVNEEFKVGDVLLIENLQWTTMFMVKDKGQKYWQTKAEHVLATIDPDNPPEEIKNFL
jgi:co-chaperonin GroES (HSP10)